MQAIRLSTFALYAVFILAAGIFLFPLFSVVSLSMKTADEVFAWPPALLPESLNFATYRYVLQETLVGRMLWNSAQMTFFSVIGAIVISAPAAYAFSRFQFRMHKPLLLLLLVYQMISTLVVAIPLYRYFESLNLLDSHLGVILVYITVEIPFTIWLLKGFFDSIPQSIDEAATLDGANRFQILTRILLPLAKPGLAAAVIFNAIAAWSQFIVPYLLLSKPEILPISIGILNFAPGQSEGEVTIPYLAAASILALLPAVLVLVVLQRFIVQALTGGAVKG
ncbi:ABC transporter permease (plasmid) [Microvirga ossetica]|uniref:Maltose/maltodextrin transport system permease protein MalG n=1 Tax=Microvirga ossetica TaxID=1882682 RepID=A0A1B2EVV4_9HYPH|nr:carbohydrate ABC transporter permease [Microvirga ossetica]ANY84089.1 ABC transporter permease [Microvirga ossetica]